MLSDRQSVLQDVKRFTLRATPPEYRVALYFFGSAVRNEMDEWSDIDVCLVRAASDDALPHYRSWMNGLVEAFGYRVDACGIPVDHLGHSSYWGFAYLLKGLIENSELLLGEDVRPGVVMPFEHKLRLSVCHVAASSIRRLYEVGRCAPLPEALPVLREAIHAPMPFGNFAWEVFSTVFHLIRAVHFLETGVLISSKTALRHSLRERGDGFLQDGYTDAMVLRNRVPRYGALSVVTDEMHRLCAAIPPLVNRFQQDLTDIGMADPSYEPGGASLYESDGSLKHLMNLT